jgi:hypothetical protein
MEEISNIINENILLKNKIRELELNSPIYIPIINTNIHINSDILLINAPKNFWNNNKFFTTSIINNKTLLKVLNNDENVLTSTHKKLNIIKNNNYSYNIITKDILSNYNKKYITINNFPDNVIDTFSNILKHINYTKAIVFIDEWDIHYRYFRDLFDIRTLEEIIFVIPNKNKYKWLLSDNYDWLLSDNYNWHQSSTISYLESIINKYGFYQQTDKFKITFCTNYK